MKTFKLYLQVSILLFLTSCVDIFNNDDYHFTYETIVTEIPVNLEEINSIYDDYNSDLPYEGFRHGIYFSSNRYSYGDNFDIIYKEMDISYHSKDDLINISFIKQSNTYDRLGGILETIKSDYDEFGPYSYWGQDGYEYFFYANNESGNFDIKYVSSKKGDPSNYNLTKSFTALNSEYDDIYPSISSNNSNIYFCSNRQNGIFNIYNSTFNENDVNPEFEINNNKTIEMNNILSSDKDDKCPFIYNEIIVFASDRDGGYGGFDLYYSKNIDGVWSQPQNLGDKINTEYDEYRPIIVPFYEFDETMLIFSSNRQGGKGGFDLYSVRTKI